MSKRPPRQGWPLPLQVRVTLITPGRAWLQAVLRCEDIPASARHRHGELPIVVNHIDETLLSKLLDVSPRDPSLGEGGRWNAEPLG